ncbi:protein of unknown function [Streptomyces sp. KY75]|nr:protein of unknown function [Streptomyces sp. KY70]CAD5974105.1 protein of unknown function [Streptomyces sp. KY75]
MDGAGGGALLSGEGALFSGEAVTVLVTVAVTSAGAEEVEEGAATEVEAAPPSAPPPPAHAPAPTIPTAPTTTAHPALRKPDRRSPFTPITSPRNPERSPVKSPDPSSFLPAGRLRPSILVGGPHTRPGAPRPPRRAA